MNKITRKLLTISLALIMLICYAPNAVKADDIKPTDLKWGEVGEDGSFPAYASWEYEGSANKYIVRLCDSEGNPIDEKAIEEPTEKKVNLDKLIAKYGKDGGDFKFSVTPVVGGTERETETSEIAKRFYTISFDWPTKDSEEADDHGTIFVENSNGGYKVNYKPRKAYFVTVPGDNVTVKLESDIGYLVESYTVDGTKYTVNDIFGEYSFKNLNQSHTFEVVFKEDNEKVDVDVEFGEGHKKIAEDVEAAINNDTTSDFKDCRAELNGTLLTVSGWPRSSTAIDFDGYFDDIIDDLGRIDDTGEAVNDYAVNLGTKPLDDYNDLDALDNEQSNYKTTRIDKINKFYVLWMKPVTEIKAKIESPICGDVISEENNPVITITSEKPQVECNSSWTNQTEVVGGNDYYAIVSFPPAFGYYYAGNSGYDVVDITIDNGTITNKEGIFITIKVKADHDWSDWVITKEPTETTEGEAYRKCKVCDEEETKTLSYGEDYSCTKGSGLSWTKGSSNGADFTFKNTENDEETFDKFVCIKIDGTVVKQENYTATKGSVNISLKPSYLESLSAREHTLRVYFTDGVVDTKFTISNKSKPSYTPPVTGIE